MVFGRSEGPLLAHCQGVLRDCLFWSSRFFKVLGDRFLEFLGGVCVSGSMYDSFLSF
jgi:hypothetical protein